jgi:hypothetical protein
VDHLVNRHRHAASQTAERPPLRPGLYHPSPIQDHTLKVVVDGKTLAMWALIGERGSGKSTVGLPRPAWAAKVAGRSVRWQAALG